MGMDPITMLAISAAVGTGYSIYQGEKASAQQEKSLQMQEQAQQEAKSAAKSQERKSEMAYNAANRKTPDVGAIMSSAEQAAKGGPSGTMLTGPAGVDPNQLALGKNTLLGG